jgi:hypothetical protein
MKINKNNWSGFLGIDDEIRLSSTSSCNCVVAPCNCDNSDVSLGLDEPMGTGTTTGIKDPLPNMKVPMSDKKDLSWLTLVGLGVLGYFLYKQFKK